MCNQLMGENDDLLRPVDEDGELGVRLRVKQRECTLMLKVTLAVLGNGEGAVAVLDSVGAVQGKGWKGGVVGGFVETGVDAGGRAKRGKHFPLDRLDLAYQLTFHTSIIDDSSSGNNRQ